MAEVAEIRAAVCNFRTFRDVGDIGGLFSRVKGRVIEKNIFIRGLDFIGISERVIGVYMAENGLRNAEDVNHHLEVLADEVHLKEPRDSQKEDWYYAQDKLAERIIDFYERWGCLSPNSAGSVAEEYRLLGEDVKRAERNF